MGGILKYTWMPENRILLSPARKTWIISRSSYQETIECSKKFTFKSETDRIIKVKINLLGYRAKQTFKCAICLKLIVVSKRNSKKLHLCKICKQDRKKIYYINHRIASLKRWDPPKEYNLTFEDLWKLKLGNCRYCNEKATEKNTNGIDRINYKIGYILKNCVSCCYICNIMKQTLSPELFLYHIEKIYKHNFIS